MEIRLSAVNKFFHNLETMKEVVEQLGYVLPDNSSLTSEILLVIM